MEGIENVDKAIEETMKLFRESGGPGEHSPEVNRQLARVALTSAQGEYHVSIKKDGETRIVKVNAKGNPAGMAVAAYALLDRIRANSLLITFSDMIEWMKFMEDQKNGSARAGEDSE